MPSERLLERLRRLSGDPSGVSCAICGRAFESSPRNCHACGGTEFEPR